VFCKFRSSTGSGSSGFLFLQCRAHSGHATLCAIGFMRAVGGYLADLVDSVGHSETVKRVDFGDDGSRFAGGACVVCHLCHPRLQGYLAHNKQPNPLGQQMDPG